MEGGLRELDETTYWLELLVESNFVPTKRLADLLHEADELLAVFASSIKTATQKR